MGGPETASTQALIEVDFLNLKIELSKLSVHIMKCLTQNKHITNSVSLIEGGREEGEGMKWSVHKC